MSTAKQTVELTINDINIIKTALEMRYNFLDDTVIEPLYINEDCITKDELKQKRKDIESLISELLLTTRMLAKFEMLSNK